MFSIITFLTKLKIIKYSLNRLIFIREVFFYLLYLLDDAYPENKNTDFFFKAAFHP